MGKEPSTYYALFQFQGITEDQVYTVSEETCDSLSSWVRTSGTSRPPTPMACFETLNGWSVIIALRYIQVAHFAWEPPGLYLTGGGIEPAGKAGEVLFSLHDQEGPNTERISDARDIFEVFSALDGGFPVENEFLSFKDEDGDVVSFNTSQLVWFRAATKDIEDGRKEVMSEGKKRS